MAVIEVLSYSPFHMDDFRRFCIEGKPTGQGGFETDGQRRMKIGVLRWLHGRQVPEAHFFGTPIGDRVTLFMALVDKPEPPDQPVPWMRFIPGIEEQINPDGVIGQIDGFPSSITALLAAVQPDNDLDQAFIDGRANVQEVLRQIEAGTSGLTITKDNLLKALERGINVVEVFREVQTVLGISL